MIHLLTRLLKLRFISNFCCASAQKQGRIEVVMSYSLKVIQTEVNFEFISINSVQWFEVLREDNFNNY
jgi:hypothetical protein